MVQQTNNKAYVVGLLKEKKIEIKNSKNGKLMAAGHLIVAIDTPSGKSEIKVKVMHMALKKDGSENSLFKGMKTVATTYKASNDTGVENADTIKIEGSLNDETYYSMNKNDFVNLLQIKATFINRVDKATPHCCKVAFEGFISKITPVEKELDVEIVGIGYEGVAVPVSGFIPENLISAFQTRYNVGATTTLNFNIINHVETKPVQEEVGFGEDLGEVIETITTKRMIFGGGAVNYQGITKEQVQKGMAIRESNLEKKKEEAIKNSGDNMSAGFGGNSVDVNNTGFANMNFGGSF